MPKKPQHSGPRRAAAKGGAAHRPTIREIAEQAGVSPATVSSVLSGSPRPYAADTRRRVQEVAKQLGYVPNLLASTLKKQRTGLIGVIVFSHESSYYEHPLQAAESCAQEHGYEVISFDLHFDLGRLAKCLDWMSAWRVEGLILMAGGEALPPDALERIGGMGIPCVRRGGWEGQDNLTGLQFNNRQAGEMLARHLLDLGHRRLAILTAAEGNVAAEQRLQGIRGVVAERGLDPGGLHVLRAPRGRTGLSAGHAMAGEVLEGDYPATALLCLNDWMALGALRRLHEGGLTIPRDMSVTGCDDLDLGHGADTGDRLSAYFWPALTTARVPLRPLGHCAAKLVIEMIEDPRLREAKRVIEFAPELVVRESTAPPPAQR